MANQPTTPPPKAPASSLLRQQLAGQALAGICANPYLADYMQRNRLSTEVAQQKYADTAVAMADLVIARLEKAP